VQFIFVRIQLKTLIPSTNSIVGTTTYICRMVFHCMSCQFHSQKVKRCQTDKVMTCAAFVQMVVSFSFVIPVQELFTEVMTLCIAIVCMRCFVFAYCSIKLHLTFSLRYGMSKYMFSSGRLNLLSTDILLMLEIQVSDLPKST
jgi:hypothetical protein